MVKNISSTLNAKQIIEREGIRGVKGRASRECMPTDANNNAISVDRDPVHVYKMYKEKRPPSMLEPES